ncbi:MAG: efflux RND transporter periplasmic adaptor subunit, partial [Wenzhouxiangella sp.]
DEAETQVESLSTQLDEARSRLETAQFNLSRTRIESPVSGRIQRRLVSSGDFVSPGRELFELVAADALRAILPLPERLQDEISIGQRVRLSIPSRPDERIEASVSELRPMISGDARSIELIVDLENPGSWRSGGSVTGRVVVEQREGLVIPPGALVRRPAGDVVYVVGGDRAVEHEVTVGLRHPEWIEIRSGLKEDEAVVLDGAGFLSDGALLDLQGWGGDRAADGGGP